MNWHRLQDQFAVAVRDPIVDVPNGVGQTRGLPSSKRFNVYRNNGAVSLSEALASGYPVVQQLVGEEFFSGLAQSYVREKLPESPVMLGYGASLAEFIEEFEPAKELPFLADVARIEWAWACAYHAADRDPVGIEALQTIASDRLEETRFELHPSLQLISSQWPAVSIWSAHQADDEQTRLEILGNIAQAPETGLLVRPAFDVTVQLVDQAVLDLLRHLSNGSTLGSAVEQLPDEDQQQFGNILNFIFSIGTVVAIR